jgi:hypothetical protein
MVRRAASGLGIDPAEPKLGKIELVNEDINHPNRIVLTDPVFQRLRKQRALTAIRARSRSADMTSCFWCSVGYPQRAKSLREFDGWTFSLFQQSRQAASNLATGRSVVA